jgi:hypothetical protein
MFYRNDNTQRKIQNQNLHLTPFETPAEGILALQNATQNRVLHFWYHCVGDMILFNLQASKRVQESIFHNGTLTATEALMKRKLSLLAVLALLTAVAGCGQSNSTNGNSDAGTNTSAQDAHEAASQAWQDTKGAATNAWTVAKIGATNAWNATKVGATNAWNKTTNAIH